MLEFQQVLIEPNEEIPDIYFPYDAMTSTLQEMSDGDAVETGLMGVEGFVGVQLWLAGLIKYSRGQMQIVDADGLRNGSCECLEIMERQFEKIFEHPLKDDLK